MEEIVPGIHHWTAFHERIRTDVHSYFVAGSGTLIDPMLPAEGLEWFERPGARRPERILLTNRHHYRHSDRFREAFGCPVLCSEHGLHEFEGGPEVRGFAADERVAPDVVAREVGGICPDDSALQIETGDGLIAFADALVRYRGALGFVPDELFDDPEGDKRAVRASLERLLELDFDSLLFAHGDPLVGGGKAALRDFLSA